MLRGESGRDVARLPLPLFVAGVGKAAARMALGCERLLGPEHVRGLVITAHGCEAPLQSVRSLFAGHPLPDRRGVEATRDMIETLKRLREPVLFLLSGGASSLLVQPRAPVSLADKIATSELLLACGAEIGEFNTVRKHLSLVKGGGLLRCAAGPVYTLVISDVVGDDLAVIGSGPTVPDPSTYADARAVLARYDLLGRVPGSVRSLLQAGCGGKIEETVKPADAEAARSTAVIVGSNRIALAAAATAAAEAGWKTAMLGPPLQGDTRVAAGHFAAEIERALALARESGDRICLLAGGETTVRLTGSGRGGRNQEFALALARNIEGLPVAILSAGSDGVDGPTDAAGAFADGATLGRGLGAGLEPNSFLANNDSYRYFDTLGDLFRPGPTGTNVMDLKFALIGADSPLAVKLSP